MSSPSDLSQVLFYTNGVIQLEVMMFFMVMIKESPTAVNAGVGTGLRDLEYLASSVHINGPRRLVAFFELNDTKFW